MGIRKPKQTQSSGLLKTDKVVLLNGDFVDICASLMRDQQDYVQVTGVEKEIIREKSYHDTRVFVTYINACYQKARQGDLYTKSEIENVKKGVTHQLKFFCEDFTVLAMDLQFEQLMVQYLEKSLEYSRADRNQRLLIQEEIASLGFAMVNHIEKSYFQATQKSFFNSSNQKKTV